MPLLSIVIANYNYGRFLESAIQSVIMQIGVGKNKVSPDEIELIIIDGGSTDNSVEIIQKYAIGLPAGVRRDDPSTVHLHLSPTPITYWVSEKDRGQSDAFNKGFAKAKGKYLTWLNADDLFSPGCLAKVVSEMMKHPTCEWFTANFRRISMDGKVLEIGWGPHFYPRFLQTSRSPLVVFGPSTFFSKRIFDMVGGFVVSQRFMMDTDLWLRFILGGIKQRRINCFCWEFRAHSDSKTSEVGHNELSHETLVAMYKEESAMLKRLGYRGSRFLLFIIRVLRLVDGSFFRLLWMKRCYCPKGVRPVRHTRKEIEKMI